MRKTAATAFASLWIVIALGDPGKACTTFCLEAKGGLLFGRNYDWMVEAGMVVINKRNVEKRALISDNPAVWTSKYGSVTFNQYGRENPLGGMNEAGLVLECMWLSETEYPGQDARPQLGELQWIQYQLDRSSSVREVLASDETVRVAASSAAKIHFLAADAGGACASIEFLGGKMVVHQGASMPARALTNSTYTASRSFLESAGGKGREGNTPGGDESLRRFHHVARRLKEFKAGKSRDDVAYAFEVLDQVAFQGDRAGTQWSIVYDLASRRIFFRTRSNRAIRSVDMGEFDFSCSKPVRILDMSEGKAGPVHKAFTDYSFDANERLIRTAFDNTEFLRQVPDEVRQRLAGYPESTTCRP